MLTAIGGIIFFIFYLQKIYYKHTAMENIIDRITKLLALSQSPNQNEAQAAAAKAQELLMLHNLKKEDLAVAIDQNTIGIHKIDSSSRRVFWKIFLARNIALC